MQSTNSPAKIISIINMKGGVGKTSLTKELGFFLSTARKKNILFIDLDPQSNLTQSIFKKFDYISEDDISKDTKLQNLMDLEYLEGDEEKDPKFIQNRSLKQTKATIHNLFKNPKIDDVPKDDCILKINDNLSIMPGTLKSIFSERVSNIENNLYNFIEKYSLDTEFDYIFIDCPPTYSNYTVAAFLASNYYITPMRPDAYSVLGIDMLYQVIEEIKKIHKIYFKSKTLKALGVVISELQPQNTGIKKQIEQIKDSTLLKQLGIEFFENHFVYNPSIPKKAEYFIVDSYSQTSEYIVTLVDELERRINNAND
ncbi:ParA family protein [Kurthia gibsonii]|uniref:ParA family protein n=1 Tax=Kurthia gibsonii TaxID=33946 RepID=UPI0030164E84